MILGFVVFFEDARAAGGRVKIFVGQKVVPAFVKLGWVVANKLTIGLVGQLYEQVDQSCKIGHFYLHLLVCRGSLLFGG